MNNLENKDIVITSRIRLARNLKNYKFPIKMTADESDKVISEVKSAVEKQNLNYKLTYMKDLSDIEKSVLIENHLISPALAEKKEAAALLLSTDQRVSIMLNEEDHIRIQTLENGMSLKECWNESNRIDDILEEHVDYAFDKELGFVTSCPTNIGTGMRASVMLHLPALSITNQIDKLIYGISQLGVAVRGVYGEGTKSMGHLYQISNQGTLGASEETLIDKISQIVIQIVEKEERTREHLKKNNLDEIEDDFYRSYGLLTNARKMTAEEAMKLLSLLKLGKEMGIIKISEDKNLYNLMVKIQPNNISSVAGKELSPKERDKKRAEIIRNELLYDISE
ncbi:MAG: protein arginine kinase [Sedimentibacter sp.]|uniref:protein arginine kinase n=1 Tax=Sedimentibacter sp. TaxID=1960295 RepID=UPI0029829AFC|nr:protein arginine kinase [Sedimentibacter sp.]MDW5299389.1 protein arginine kinase [Sedimentibacter sp.]